MPPSFFASPQVVKFKERLNVSLSLQKGGIIMFPITKEQIEGVIRSDYNGSVLAIAEEIFNETKSDLIEDIDMVFQIVIDKIQESSWTKNIPSACLVLLCSDKLDTHSSQESVELTEDERTNLPSLALSVMIEDVKNALKKMGIEKFFENEGE